MKNIYEKINQQVLEGLEKEGLNWFRPWKSGGANQPMNYSTGKFYRGFNIFMLNFVMVDKEYQYNQWMTYKQAQAKGGQVKSGETATDVYFYKVDIDSMDRSLLNDYNVRSVPKIVMFVDGHEVADMIGSKPKEEVSNFISEHKKS